MMPYEGTSPWSTQTIAGVYRFLNRAWKIYQNYVGNAYMRSVPKENNKLIIKLKKTIKKVTEDINDIKMNTAIASMMEFLNAWESNPQGLSKENAKKFLQILAPFAPFLTEEIWRNVFGEKTSIHLSVWPKVEGEIVDEEIIIPIQVNGKLRSTLRVSRHEISKDIVVNKALEDKQVKKYLESKDYKVIYVEGKILNFIVK